MYSCQLFFFLSRFFIFDDCEYIKSVETRTINADYSHPNFSTIFIKNLFLSLTIFFHSLPYHLSIPTLPCEPYFFPLLVPSSSYPIQPPLPINSPLHFNISRGKDECYECHHLLPHLYLLLQLSFLFLLLQCYGCLPPPPPTS